MGGMWRAVVAGDAGCGMEWGCIAFVLAVMGDGWISEGARLFRGGLPGLKARPLLARGDAPGKSDHKNPSPVGAAVTDCVETPRCPPTKPTPESPGRQRP